MVKKELFTVGFVDWRWRMDDKKDLISSTLNHGPWDWTSSNTKIVFKAHGCNYHGGGGGKRWFFFFFFFFLFEQFYLPLELGHFHGTNINVMICLPYKSHNVPLPQKLLIFIFIFFNFFFLREYTPLVTYFIYLINQFFWSWEYNDDHNLQLRSKIFKTKKERKK